MQQRFFIADLIAYSTCFGHHYAYHQELKSIIQWLLPVVFRVVVFKVAGLVWSWGLYVRFAGYCSILQTGRITLNSTPDQQLENHSTKYHRQQPLYNTLELLMMGTVVPETCWASNKICNKKPLLHLVGILFPHIVPWSQENARKCGKEILVLNIKKHEHFWM